MDNFRSPAALSRFFLVMLLGLGLDLWSKAYAFRTLAPQGVEYVTHSTTGHGQFQPVVALHHVFIPGWLTFTVTCNQGAVFGIGQGQLTIFIVVSVGAIGFLTYLFATSGRQRFYQVILGLLLAGVLGNMYDRVNLGYVRDMIYALPGWKLPGSKRDVFPWIFNVADVLLCTGVGLMIAYSFFARRPALSSRAEQTATA